MSEGGRTFKEKIAIDITKGTETFLIFLKKKKSLLPTSRKGLLSFIYYVFSRFFCTRLLLLFFKV